MNVSNDSVKQANRKAFPKFILFTLACGLVGGVVGFCFAWFGLDRLAGVLAAAGRVFSLLWAPWLLIACAVLRPAVCVPGYFSAKKLVAAWDGEDDEAQNRIDRKITVTQWINLLFNVVIFFLFGAVFSGFFASLTAEGKPVLFPLSLAAFLIGLVEGIMLERRFVDLAKRMAPEKDGSVYDLKFRKKWLASCDEAEKLMIGRCAYKAYTAVNITCIVLWMIFTISAMFLNTGFLPVLVICIIWGVSASVYNYWAIKLSRPGCPAL